MARVCAARFELHVLVVGMVGVVCDTGIASIVLVRQVMSGGDWAGTSVWQRLDGGGNGSGGGRKAAGWQQEASKDGCGGEGGGRLDDRTIPSITGAITLPVLPMITNVSVTAISNVPVKKAIISPHPFAYRVVWRIALPRTGRRVGWATRHACHAQ
jgi:hypothetical protein